jgi:lipoprotein-releasing system permease protein
VTRGLVYLALDDVRTLLGLQRVATGIEAVLDDPYAAPAVARSLNERLGMPYFAQSWTEIHRNVFEALQPSASWSFFAVIAVAAFTIVSTLYMVVRSVATWQSQGHGATARASR